MASSPGVRLLFYSARGLTVGMSAPDLHARGWPGGAISLAMAARSGAELSFRLREHGAARGISAFGRPTSGTPVRSPRARSRPHRGGDSPRAAGCGGGTGRYIGRGLHGRPEEAHPEGSPRLGKARRAARGAQRAPGRRVQADRTPKQSGDRTPARGGAPGCVDQGSGRGGWHRFGQDRQIRALGEPARRRTTASIASASSWRSRCWWRSSRRAHRVGGDEQRACPL